MDETIHRVYLINFNGYRYAVREDEVVNLFIPVEIMLLPSSPEGREIFVTTLDDNLFYLYDLTPFLGGSAGDFESARQVLILSETDKIHGFFINHICDEPQVPELSLPLPGYIRSPLLDSAVIIDGKPLPLLNLRELLRRMQEEKIPDAGISFQIESTGNGDITRAERYYRYSHGSQSYCIPDFMIPDTECVQADIVPVSFYPEQVAGLARYQESIIPVICILGSGEDKESSGHFVVFAAGDEDFGLLADTREGEIDPAQMPVRDFPPVARSRGCSHAFVDDGKIYPLVDLYGVLDDMGDKREGDEFKDLYIPTSSFPSVFFNDLVEIMEFEFGGSCYGLPREEVMECFSFMEYSRFPGLPAMIPGILFYKDELLPVLDLALWSGESSYSARYRDMVFLVNGNLRLIIAVEKVLDWKRIEREGQRKYRHLFVYGCYKDEKLKLILNIHAMLQNYEKIEFTLVEPRRGEETGALAAEEEPIPEEIPEPEAPAEAAGEEDVVEIKEMSESEDTFAKEDSDLPPVREKTEPGEGETGKTDRIPERESADLKKDDLPVSEAFTASEKREAPHEKRDESIRETLPTPEEKTKTAEKIKEGPVAARGKKALLALLLVVLFALMAGLLYRFIFSGPHEIVSVKEEGKTETGKESLPDEKVEKEGPEKTGTRKGVKSAEGSRFILFEDEKRIVFQHVLFSADSHELLPAEVRKLDGIASLIALNRDKQVRITGHTARFGTESGRKFLSRERADAAGKYLVSAGACKEEQLRYRSMGAAVPVADNSSPEGRKKNRRVEIILFKD